MSAVDEADGAPDDGGAAAPPAAPATEFKGVRGRLHRWRPSIGTVMALGFGGLVAIAIGGVLLVALGAAGRTTVDLMRSLAESGTEEIVQALDHHLEAPLNGATFVSGMIERGDVDPADGERLSDILIGALAATPQVAGIAFVRADLSAVGAGRSADGRRVEILAGSWVDRPEMRLAVRGAATLDGPRWGDPKYLPTLSGTYVTLRVPVRRDGIYLGIVATAVSIIELSEILGGLPGRFDSRPFVILGRDHVLAHPALAGGLRGASADKPLPTLAEVGDPVLAAMWSPRTDEAADAFLGDSDVSAWSVDVNGEEEVFLYREVKDYGDTPWLVGLHFRLAEVNAPVERLMLAGLLGLGILVVAAAAALLLGRRIARPIRRLAAAAEAVSRFELTAAPPLSGSAFRELDAAARAYNAMLAALRWFEVYVPRALVLILLQRGDARLRPEEREVTVMLTDIVGFTPISSRLRPLQLARFLTRHFTLLGRCIEAEGGTVDKYMGDAVMAFWNAPEAQPDHAARAARAALAIGRTLRADNARRTRKGIRPVRLRIGLHTGPAVVGNTGAPGRVNYTLVGETVNVCSRLEELGHNIDAGQDSVLVLLSGQTAAQLTPDFHLVPLGRPALRGTDAVVDVFRLIDPQAGREDTLPIASAKSGQRAA